MLLSFSPYPGSRISVTFPLMYRIQDFSVLSCSNLNLSKYVRCIRAFSGSAYLVHCSFITPLTRVEFVKYLGITIDKTWNDHLTLYLSKNCGISKLNKTLVSFIFSAAIFILHVAIFCRPFSLVYWRNTSKPFVRFCQFSIMYHAYHWKNGAPNGAICFYLGVKNLRSEFTQIFPILCDSKYLSHTRVLSIFRSIPSRINI